jgi:hypothetical protein
VSGAARPRWTRRIAVIGIVAGISLIAARAPATVEEQRARLPPAATDCEDPVAGVWKSHKYDPRFGDWYSFTLTIDRDANDRQKLVGTIHAHSWTGDPQQEEPPPCTAGVWHWTVMMTAEGTVTDDGRIHFGGTSWRFENAYCGRALSSGEYNVDNFSGIIDPEIMEFQSVNNDGGRSINDPMVFRRISCNQAPPSPHVNPVPPPFVPDQGGCGCGLF